MYIIEKRKGHLYIYKYVQRTTTGFSFLSHYHALIHKIQRKEITRHSLSSTNVQSVWDGSPVSPEEGNGGRAGKSSRDDGGGGITWCWAASRNGKIKALFEFELSKENKRVVRKLMPLYAIYHHLNQINCSLNACEHIENQRDEIWLLPFPMTNEEMVVECNYRWLREKKRKKSNEWRKRE